MPPDFPINILAQAFVSGESTMSGIVARAAHVVDGRPRWLRRVARRYLKAFANRARPRLEDVERFLYQHRDREQRLKVKHLLTEPQLMQPVAAALDWDVPVLESVGDVGRWLGVVAPRLEWFAAFSDHYHYRVLPKSNGALRIIEAPKKKLKSIQREILTGVLERVPPHSAVHGFVKGRSVRSFATPHVGQRVVLRMDLRDFFPSISEARVAAVFRTMGYPESVADLLSGLCTNATPQGVCEGNELYRRPHLPQGAPTSPALANICAYRVDCRLSGLARSAGAVYTRYADDLAFSGGREFERRVDRFSTHAAVILEEEGFVVHHRKTRVMRQGVRQHLAGVVTNERLNVMRSEFDLLKAILTNCVRYGVESQNRDGHAAFRAHLEGRVGWVESVNAARGRKLRRLLEQIASGS